MKTKRFNDPFLDAILDAVIAIPVRRVCHTYRRKITDSDIRRMTMIDAALWGSGEWVGNAAELECKLLASPFRTEYTRQVLRKPVAQMLLRLSGSFPERVIREGSHWRIKPIPSPR